MRAARASSGGAPVDASLRGEVGLVRRRGPILALIGDDTGFPKMSRLSAVVGVKKLRWRIARDDQDIQQELGLGHCEG